MRACRARHRTHPGGRDAPVGALDSFVVTSPTGDVLTETRAAAGRILERVRYRVPEIVAGAGITLTLLALLALGGAFLNDFRIDSQRATTAATVLDGSNYWRSVVRFVDNEGSLQTPGSGIFYPAGLTPGQNIYVEYDTTEPTRVRVAGRTAVDGILPVAGGIAAVWVVFGPATVALRRRRDRATRTDGATRPDGAARAGHAD